MSIFNFWQTSKTHERQSEESIRMSARKVVESGKITLEEARKAVTDNSDFTAAVSEKNKVRKAFLEQLTDRANISRKGFGYDTRSLSAADAIFVDELSKLVEQFDKEASISTMSKEQLTEAMDKLADNLNKHAAEMSRRFPSPTPAPAAKSSEVDMADVDAKSQTDWDKNVCDCRSMYPTFAAYAARKRYDANHPKMA